MVFDDRGLCQLEAIELRLDARTTYRVLSGAPLKADPIHGCGFVEDLMALDNVQSVVPNALAGSIVGTLLFRSENTNEVLLGFRLQHEVGVFRRRGESLSVPQYSMTY